MSALSEFLLARLAEDEQVARAAHGEQWSNGEPVERNGYTSRTVLRPDPGIGNYVAGSIRATHAEHIARWDPARVLADVAAKRRIVEGFQYLVADPDLRQYAWTFALRALTMPYAGHADYREEWKLWT